jgi:hypothetical protein
MNKKIKNATPEIYNNVKYRSKLEASVAKLLDSLNIDFKYEPFKITLLPAFKYLNKSLREWSYTPDFVIFNNIIVEVKGFPNDSWGIKKKMILKYIVDHNYNYEFYVIKNLNQMRSLIEELRQRENVS